MNCPFCLTTMSAEVFADIEIDRCTHCGDVWLDRDEIVAYRKTEKPA